MIWIILLIFAAVMYIVTTRRGYDQEGFQERVLLDEVDLGDSGAPTLREHLMEKEPVFFQEQLDIYNSTRDIYDKIIKTVAGVLAAEENAIEDLSKYAEPAIQSITEKAGESPRFCKKSRLDVILDAPVAPNTQPNIDTIYQCLPATPGKYLLLLSYASRILKEQFDNGAGSLGGTYAEIDLEEPPIYMENSASESTILKKGASDAAYISKYALPTVTRESFTSGSASAGGSASASAAIAASGFENQLAAWKYAFDSESMKRIKMYIRYCNKIYQKIDTIKKDAESGALLKKMNLAGVTASAKTIMNQNIPF